MHTVTDSNSLAIPADDTGLGPNRLPGAYRKHPCNRWLRPARMKMADSTGLSGKISTH
jgi:hypothetical protein